VVGSLVACVVFGVSWLFGGVCGCFVGGGGGGVVENKYVCVHVGFPVF